MMNSIALGLLILNISFLVSFQPPDKEVKKIYISINGKDSNDGSFQKPYASFEAAQQAVRNIKRSGYAGSIEVIVRAGTYYLPQTIEFTAEDSGTKSAHDHLESSNRRKGYSEWRKTNCRNLEEGKGWDLVCCYARCERLEKK